MSNLTFTPAAKRTASLVAVVLFGLMVFFGTYYTVDEGEEAVVLRYGNIVKVSEPGLHFKIPFVDSAEFIETRTATVPLKDIPVYSKDQQPAVVQLSVTFNVVKTQSGNIYQEFRTVENAFARVVEPNVLQDLKNVFGKYTATMAIQERSRLTTDVTAAIKQSLSKYPYLSINSIQIENIDFSETYEKTIEDRMRAEVEVQKAQQELAKEKVNSEIALTQAKAKAEAELLQAKAEAESLDVKGEAIRKNPEIIRLSYIEKWNGVMPQVSSGNGVTPIIQMPPVK